MDDVGDSVKVEIGREDAGVNWAKLQREQTVYYRQYQGYKITVDSIE